MAYAANKPGSEIMRFTVSNVAMAMFPQAHLGLMSDDAATEFMEKYSLLWDGKPTHGLSYITRPTAKGTENYFASTVFLMLKFD
ncbi:hypothetical protein [Streptomyces melanogenes]|uniref:hypothetical protein n=1 Tax=Streptomyces melanogenes TaxID=67326 RepID=UPI0037B7C170